MRSGPTPANEMRVGCNTGCMQPLGAVWTSSTGRFLQEGAIVELFTKARRKEHREQAAAVGTQRCNQMRSQIRARRVGVGIRLANANNGLVSRPPAMMMGPAGMPNTRRVPGRARLGERFERLGEGTYEDQKGG